MGVVPVARRNAAENELVSQKPTVSPMSVTEERDALVEAGPLYAGESVARIGDIRPAGAITRELAVLSATS